MSLIRAKKDFLDLNRDIIIYSYGPYFRLSIAVFPRILNETFKRFNYNNYNSNNR